MFIIIEDGIIDHLPVIKSQGLAIYTVLKKHINHKTKRAFPSIERIARLCHLAEKTVIKYLRILEREGLIKIIRRRINKKRCFFEYEFPEPPIAYPWEQTLPEKRERNTSQPDPKPLKKEKKERAKTVPIKEEIIFEPCACEDIVTFPDGRIMCKKCLKTGVIDVVISEPLTIQTDTLCSLSSSSNDSAPAPESTPEAPTATCDEPEPLEQPEPLEPLTQPAQPEPLAPPARLPLISRVWQGIAKARLGFLRRIVSWCVLTGRVFRLKITHDFTAGQIREQIKTSRLE